MSIRSLSVTAFGTKLGTVTSIISRSAPPMSLVQIFLGSQRAILLRFLSASLPVSLPSMFRPLVKSLLQYLIGSLLSVSSLHRLAVPLLNFRKPGLRLPLRLPHIAIIVSFLHAMPKAIVVLSSWFPG